MLEVANISKKYGKKTILNEICFNAQCGQAVAVVGRNGCGKTTLMQTLAGIMNPDSGEMRFFGEKADHNKKVIRRFCGYVPQENPLMEELTVKDNLLLWGAKKNNRLDELVREFGLENILHMPVEKLSGGMKRRLSIACSVIDNPPILLMDEPTTALDLYYKESIHNWINQYLHRNGIVVMATHDEQEILSCDKCLVLNQGKLVELHKGDISMERIKSYL